MMRASCKLVHVLLISFAVLLRTAAGQGGVRPVNGDDDGVCEPIDASILCADVGYNTVFVPNARGHETQAAADMEIRNFNQLIATGCSDALYVFLCSYYFPLCFLDPSTGKPIKVKTCRSLCEFVRPACEPDLIAHDFPWPVFLNCSLDDFSDDASCFGPAVLTNLSIPSSESPPISIPSSESPFVSIQVLNPTPTATPTVVSVSPTPPPQVPTDSGTTAVSRDGISDADRTITNYARILNAKVLNFKALFATITVVVLICNHLI